MWIGLVSVLPMLAFLGWILRSEHPPFAEIRNCCDSLVRQCFGKESWFSIALLSVVADVGEEVLFRAVLQSGLSVHTVPVVGILAARFLFAACHALTKGYFASEFTSAWFGRHREIFSPRLSPTLCMIFGRFGAFCAGQKRPSPIPILPLVD